MTSASAASRRRKAAADRKAAEEDVHISAAESYLVPPMPGDLRDPNIFKSLFEPGTLEGMFARARALLKHNDFFGGVHYVKLCHFGDGMRAFDDETGQANKDWLLRAREMGLDIHALEQDVWTEFLACDNAVVFWIARTDGRFPLPVVLDCECLQYSDALGAPMLKVKPNRVKLTPAQKAALGPRWADAIDQGKIIELDESKGEYFRVLKWAKVGAGFGYPRLGQILDKLGLRELLELADRAGAYEHGDVIRHVTKGHSIDSGDKAGSPAHFITKKQSASILKAMMSKRGPRTVVSNFDMEIAWKFLDPKFFDKAKYEGVESKLRSWAGAPGMMHEQKEVSPDLMRSFGVEGRRVRGLVGRFLSDLINSPLFTPSGLKPPQPVEISWNEQTFLNMKMMLEWIRAGYSNGLLSPQTARDALGVENQREADRLKEAAKDLPGYTPVFEPKQGMLSNPGRPSDNPGALSNPTGAGD